jgi:hypothetical protein
MEEALKEAFSGDTRLFPQCAGNESIPSDGDSHAIYRNKVAVTATTPSGDKEVLFSNYNRRHHKGLKYTFDRPKEPNDEILVWEA